MIDDPISPAADVARLQSNAAASVAATQRALTTALRLIAAQAERLQILEDAVRREAASRANFEAAAADRAKLLVPPTMRPKPAAAAAPQPMPEPKTLAEIPAYVAKLRGMANTLSGMAEKSADPAEKVRLEGLVARLNAKIALWEAKLKPSPDEPEPEPAASPAPVRKRMI